jgi:hypothetical protein
VTALPGGDRFRAIVTTVVPEAAALSEEEWRAAASIIGRALASRPPGVRRQLGLFVHTLDILSLVRHGRGLRRLPLAERTRLLDSVSRSRVLALRRGIWGVRTLAFMGYYARAEAARAIGYRAATEGWSARAAAPNVS